MCDFRSKKLLVFGDSIMFGSGNNGFGVGEYLERDLGFDLHKYCVGGARVGFFPDKNWMVEQVREAVNDKVSADYIVFDGFTNDCCKTDKTNFDVPLGVLKEGYEGYNIFAVSKEGSTTSDCLENIVHAFKIYFPKAKLLFVRPHNMGRREDTAQRVYGERAVAICEKWGVPVCDLYKISGLNTFLPEDRDKYTNDSYGWGRGDCTHPNALGYEEKYMPFIEEALRSL